MTFLNRLAPLVCLSLLVAQPAEAAKRKVVVLTFAGAGGAAARSGVLQGLGKKVIQVRPGAYEDAADELSVDGSTAEGMVAICTKLKCDAVVKGVVKKKGRKITLTVTVHDGGTGDVLGRRAATVRGNRKLAAAGVAIGGACVTIAADGHFARGKPKVKPPPPEPKPVVRRPPPEPVPEYKPEPPPKPRAKPKKVAARSKGHHEGDEGDEHVSSGDDDEEGVRKSAYGSGRDLAGLFDVSIAVGLSSRRAAIDLVTPSGSTPPSSYDGGMYPEFTLRAGFFPLTLATKGFMRGLGLTIGYTRHLTISTKVKAAGGAETPVDTTSQELLLDLRLRWVILKSQSSPVVDVFAGFGLRDFSLATNQTVMTSLNYQFMHLGLEGGVPFGTPLVGAFVGFDVRPLFKVGEEATNHLGNKTSGLGFSIRGGLQGRHPGTGIFYFLSVEYLRFNLGFAGLTASGVDPSQPPPDGRKELDRADPTTGTDRYVRFWAGAGFMY